MNNKKFAVARERRDDEYYTLYADVKRECDKYLEYFKDKVIYSNCDFADSAFNQYFGDLWKRGLIKRYICSGIDPKTNEPFYSDTERPFDYIRNGDYGAKEATDLLQEADIVVTNPPYSKYSHYLSVLDYYKKDYLLIGYSLAVSYRYTIQLLLAGKIRTGYNTIKYFDHISGQRRPVNSLWITTLPVTKYFELKEIYKPGKYKRIAGYDIINVDNVHDIPRDYTGLMCIPQTALIKLGSDQIKMEGFIYHPIEGSRRLFNRYIVRLANV